MLGDRDPQRITVSVGPVFGGTMGLVQPAISPPHLTVNVIDVEAVLDEDELSVPVIVMP